MIDDAVTGAVAGAVVGSLLTAALAGVGWIVVTRREERREAAVAQRKRKEDWETLRPKLLDQIANAHRMNFGGGEEWDLKALKSILNALVPHLSSTTLVKELKDAYRAAEATKAGVDAQSLPDRQDKELNQVSSKFVSQLRKAVEPNP